MSKLVELCIGPIQHGTLGHRYEISKMDEQGDEIIVVLLLVKMIRSEKKNRFSFIHPSGSQITRH